MKRKWVMILAGLLIIITLFLGNKIINNEGIQEIEKEASVNLKEKTREIITQEKRNVEIKIDSKYDIDREKLLFKTDEQGDFSGTYIFNHTTTQDEKLVFYAFSESEGKALPLLVNGEINNYHSLEIPKEGEVKVDFTIKDLSEGSHIIYLISEKLIDQSLTDDFSKKQNQEVFSTNYFELEVNTKSTKDSNLIFKKLEKVRDYIGEDDRTPLRLFNDEELNEETLSINKETGQYYLIFKNSSKYETSGILKVLKNYDAENVDYIKVPAQSVVMIPIKLEKLDSTDSVRFILLSQPEIDNSIEFPMRTIKLSPRIFVE